MLVEDTLTIVVQVNGRLRATINVPAEISQEELKKIVFSNEKVKPWIQDKPIRNCIIVPGKIVNIVL
jgi:leucyl-tRNA synthetase